jgi:GNAT superfamily N-acetyltransferase
MWWRLTHAEFESQKGDTNRQALEKLVSSGEVPGILAFDGPRAVGWCSVAPREQFARLARSRILKPVDDTPVWSIVCLFVAREYRNRGVSQGLLEAAKDWVEQQGGQVIEGYPVEPKKERVPPLFVFTGLASAFAKAGFAEVSRRSPTRPIMRFEI